MNYEAFEKEIGARVTKVCNGNTRRTSHKRGVESEYSLLNSWAECIEFLLKKENLWDEKNDEKMKEFKSL